MCDNGGGGSKREEMKKLLKQLRSVYDKVDMNIYNSTKNVNLNTLISYVKDEEIHHGDGRGDDQCPLRDLR